MKLSYINGFGNKGNTFGAEGIPNDILQQQEASQINQPKYLTPDYFLASSSNSYYGRRNKGGNLKQRFTHSRILRIVSISLLSLGLLAIGVEATAYPNKETEVISISEHSNLDISASPDLKPSTITPIQSKKKPLISRAAHKVVKRLGFSSNVSSAKNPQDLSLNQPEISLEELKELYAAEYGESIDESIQQTQGNRGDALARTLNRTLAIRERELKRRAAEDIFAEVGTQDYAQNAEYTNNASYRNENISDTTDIYSKPVDNISLASSSSGSYAEPWHDSGADIGKALTSEFAPSAPPLAEFSLPKQIEPSAPPLSAFSTFTPSESPLSASSSIEDLQSKDLNLLSNEELKAIEILDQAIEDSGYSSPSCHSHSRSNSGANSPSMASRLNQDDFASNNQIAEPLPPQTYQTYSDSSSSSYEYDTDEDIRSYENVPANTRKKRYIKRKERGYSYQDIDQGLSNLSDDSDFSKSESEDWDDENSTEESDPYDTVYTSNNEHPNSFDSSDEYEAAAKVQNDNEDISSDDEELLPSFSPTQDGLANLTELDNLSEVSEPEQTVEVLAESISSESSDMLKQETAEEDIQDSNRDAAIDAETDIFAGNQAISDTDAQTTATEEKAARSKEELLKNARQAAISHNQLRAASKVASKQIRHRMFVRDTDASSCS